jgi:predicted enzyme related to lactoylglutathione lyase
MADASERGRFVWYDLMTSDPKKAEEFYGKVGLGHAGMGRHALHDVDGQ